MIMKLLSALLVPLSLSVALSGCTLNEGDPQTTLCQKLTEHLMTANGVTWDEAKKVPGEDLKVTVSFNNEDGSTTQATCVYGANDRDQGEDYEFNPDSFLNTPDSMVINGKAVRTGDLHTALQKVMGQSFKDTANEEHLRKTANNAKEAVVEGAEKTVEAVKEGAAQAKDAAGVAAKNIKEGSEVLRQKTGEVLEKVGEKLQK